MTFAENIVDVFYSATDEEHAEGMSWYNRAHDFALSLDDDVWRAAGVIAAMSPLKEWGLNMRMAENAYATGAASGHFGVMCGQADRILMGEPTLNVLGGDKVRAFATAIATSGNEGTAVIDRHAYDVALGAIHTDDTRKIGKTVYRNLAEAYFQAGIELGVRTHDVQAVTWTVWRNRK